jgi:hypothetical protein
MSASVGIAPRRILLWSGLEVILIGVIASLFGVLMTERLVADGL